MAERLREVEARPEHAARRGAPVALVVDDAAALHPLERGAQGPAAHPEAVDVVGDHELLERLVALSGEAGDAVSGQVVEADRRHECDAGAFRGPQCRPFVMRDEGEGRHDQVDVTGSQDTFEALRLVFEAEPELLHPPDDGRRHRPNHVFGDSAHRLLLQL